MDRVALRARREALGLSQNEVNRRCSFAPALYAQIERGTKPATPEHVATIDAVLSAATTAAPAGQEATTAAPPKAPRRRKRADAADTAPVVPESGAGTSLESAPADAATPPAESSDVATPPKRVRKRAAVVAAVAPADDESLHPALRTFSAAKLDEAWTDRPAQIQVLRNVLHGVAKPNVRQVQEIKEAMAGRPLRDVARVAADVLGLEASA